MARNLSIYPKATIQGSAWTVMVKVHDTDTGTISRFEHEIPSGVAATADLLELKLVLGLTVDDADTDQDVDDALFVDDIRPGPSVVTVWESWQARAESILATLTTPYTQTDYWAAWTNGDTQATRNDMNRALVSGPGGIGRGWTVTSVHQHEGDGTVTE